MELIRLVDEQIELFADMDPLFMASRAKLGNGFALGAIVEDEDGYDIPVGLMICTQVNNNIIINWLCIREGYRQQGVGSEMLDALVDMAHANQMNEIIVYFMDSYLRQLICPQDKRYFREYGFRTEMQLCGEWLTDVKTLIKHYDIKADRKNTNLVSVDMLPGGRMRSYVDQIACNEKTAMLFAFDVDSLRYDANISYLLINKEGIYGALLAKQSGNILYPVCFLAENEEDEKTLIFEALNASKSVYNEDMAVCVVMYSGKYYDTVKNLMPKDRVDNSVLIANVEALKNREYNDNGDYIIGLDISENIVPNTPDIEQFLRTGEERELTIGQLAGNLLVTGFECYYKVEPIGALNMCELHDVLLDCKYKNNFGVFSSLPLNPSLDWFDPDLSCCIKADGRVRCLALINIRPDGAIFPLLLYADEQKNTKYLLKLIQYMCIKGIEKYSDETKVVMRCHDERSTLLCNRLFENGN